MIYVILISFSYALIGFIGFISSILLLVVIITSPRLLSNPSNFLLLNLILSNVFISLFSTIGTIIWFIHQSWLFGPILCKALHFLQNVSVLNSSLTIATMSIDRMIRIKSRTPIPTRSHGFNFRILLETLVIWIISLVSSIPILVYRTETVDETSSCHCYEQWPGRIPRIIYSFYLAIIHLFLPFIIVLICHLLIKRYLGYNLNQMYVNQSLVREEIHLEELNRTQSSIYSIQRKRQPSLYIIYRKDVARNRRVTIILMSMAATFFLCWAPTDIFNLYLDINEENQINFNVIKYLSILFHMLSMASVSINNLLYCWLNKQVRIETKRYLSRFFKFTPNARRSGWMNQ